MSETELYAVSQGKEPIYLGDCNNAFRGAMYVWNDISKRYFNLHNFPISDKALQSRIWNAGDERPLTRTELAVLATTMDKATVTLKSVPQLIEHIDSYGIDHPNSSLSEQADILKANLTNIPDGYSVAWVQTTVSDKWFAHFDDNTDAYICDLTDAFDVFEQITDSDYLNNWGNL